MPLVSFIAGAFQWWRGRVAQDRGEHGDGCGVFDPLG
jgi:hypothetical protein